MVLHFIYDSLSTCLNLLQCQINMTCLEIWTRVAKSKHPSSEGRQYRIDRRKDRSSIPTRQKKIGQRSDDADCRLGPDLPEGVVEGGRSDIVDDLGILHAFTWRSVQPSHVPLHVSITDNWNQACHFDLMLLDLNHEITCFTSNECPACWPN